MTGCIRGKLYPKISNRFCTNQTGGPGGRWKGFKPPPNRGSLVASSLLLDDAEIINGAVVETEVDDVMLIDWVVVC